MSQILDVINVRRAIRVRIERGTKKRMYIRRGLQVMSVFWIGRI